MSIKEKKKKTKKKKKKKYCRGNKEKEVRP